MGLFTAGDEDRRHSPRFTCSGEAKIVCLPSSGLFVSAKIRDLSLGGCCVEAPFALECGMRTEMVVRINSASFRAVSQVRAIHDHAKLGMEFVQLSARGKESLAEVLEGLARLQALLNQLRSPRRGAEAEALLQELERVGFGAVLLDRHLPVSPAVPAHEHRGESAPGDHSEPLTVEGKAVIVPVDLFV